MAVLQNNNKDVKADESVLNEPVPPNSEPANPPVEEKPEVTEKKETITVTDADDTETDTEGSEEATEDKQPEETTTTPPTDTETAEDKEKRYKAQQTEAQIQAARARVLSDKVDEAAKIGDPTTEELKQYATSKGLDWDDMTPTEQVLAKDTYIARKQFALVNESVQATKKIDEWATKVDEFIDSTDGKPEFVQLSSHEADFRKFAMKESHRGTPIDILLGAFLHQLPPTKKVRGSLFERAGGGEKDANPAIMNDSDSVAKLRENDPREYRRRVKAGLIKLEA